MTANSEIINGVRTIMLAINNLNPHKACEQSTVRLRYTTFNKYHQNIPSTSAIPVKPFSRERIHIPAPAIRIEEPDFSAEFNEYIRVWQHGGNGYVINCQLNLQTECLNIQCPLKPSKTIDVSCGCGWIMSKNWTPKGLDTVDGSSSAKQI